MTFFSQAYMTETTRCRNWVNIFEIENISFFRKTDFDSNWHIILIEKLINKF